MIPASPPPFLLGAAVLFWGWQTGLLLSAAALFVLLESARLSRWRWDASRRDVNRVADLCAVLFIGLAVYLLATGGESRMMGGPRATTLLFQWAPLPLAPLLACQRYSVSGRIEVSALFWTMRRRAERPGAPPPPTIDLGYPYIVICVLAASAANARGFGFYAGACGLAAWALWSRRSPRVSVALWAGLVMLAVAAGYGGQIGLRAAQQTIEQIVLEYIFRLRGDTDPFRTSTAIGSLGRLKLSDQVVLRLTPHESIRLPLLVREASYNVYHAGSWYAVNAEFTSVQPEASGDTWRLAPASVKAGEVTISAYLNGGRGVLPLPLGVFEIDHLAVVGLSHNRLGAVKVQEGLGLVTYKARTGPRPTIDAAPDSGDRRLPSREVRVLPDIVQSLGLTSMPPARALTVLQAYFARDFRYTTWRRERRSAADALEDFLLRSRAGHCEYFATATVLLLRAAGIPARYAVGYSVQEWSRLESAYVARARHAHSWALAWIDGRWVNVDTTPASWVDEERHSEAWESLGDLWSWLVFEFSRWRWGEGGGGAAKYLAALLAPLALFLAWRIYARTRMNRRAVPAPTAPARRQGGEDSEFYLIERHLARTGFGRRPAEPAAAWARRLRGGDGLEEIVALHDRYRFDPRGLSTGEREALRSKSTAWLAVRARESAEPGDQRAMSV